MQFLLSSVYAQAISLRVFKVISKITWLLARERETELNSPEVEHEQMYCGDNR